MQSILKSKEPIMSSFQANAPASRKCSRGAKYEDMDTAVYEWYHLAREKLVPVSGPMLQEEALMIACELRHNNFKASNGWLQSFKLRHNIKQLVVSGEAGDVREETVQAWRERLPTLVQRYAPQDIWNEDETACFFRALPERTLADAKTECKGGKKAKQRITLASIINGAGVKEIPIVIGKAASPRCFKGMRDKRNPLGVPYYSNRKAWMNSEIMLDVLSKVNRQLVREKRKVILFLDNVSSHSPELADN